MSIISDLMTGGVGLLVETVVKGAGELITTDKERLAAENENHRLGVEETKAYLADTANAREANARIQESANAGFLAKNVGYWLDIAIVASTIGMVYMILFREVPTANKELFYTAFGSLMTLCMTVVNFHRSSTARSQKKDDTIKSLSTNK